MANQHDRKIDGKVYLRLDLEGSDAQQFLALKRKLGLKSNIETMRIILNGEYERSLTAKSG